MGLSNKNEQNWFKLGSIVFLAIILIAFSITIFLIINKQNAKMDTIAEQLQNRNFEFNINSKQNIDGNVVLDEIVTLSNDEIAQNIDKDILIEMIKENKYYNETLSNYQSKTISTITYVVGFFAVVAMFFGYRTISDIKQNATEETNKLSSIYNHTFEILKTQAESNKSTQENTHKKIDAAMDKLEAKLQSTTRTIDDHVANYAELAKKYEILKTDIDNIRVEQDKKAEESDRESQEVIESLSKEIKTEEDASSKNDTPTIVQKNISIPIKSKKTKE